MTYMNTSITITMGSGSSKGYLLCLSISGNCIIIIIIIIIFWLLLLRRFIMKISHYFVVSFQASVKLEQKRLTALKRHLLNTLATVWLFANMFLHFLKLNLTNFYQWLCLCYLLNRRAWTTISCICRKNGWLRTYGKVFDFYSPLLSVLIVYNNQNMY